VAKPTEHTVSMPIAVLNQRAFHYQASLFWFAHRSIYKDAAVHKAFILWAERNLPTEVRPDQTLPLDLESSPSLITRAFFETFAVEPESVAAPLNIQAAVQTALPLIDDDTVIEILDCDMAHFRAAPQMEVGDNEILVDDIYEAWHLKSRDENFSVIAPYLKATGTPFNGGFVPIIARAKTIKKIIADWANIHIDILKKDHPNKIKWWAGMFSLQAASTNHHIEMQRHNWTYIPGINELEDHHYIVHYSVDKAFNKKDHLWPYLPTCSLPDNAYYDLVKAWQDHLAATEDGITQLDDTWRHWIAKCLVLGHPERGILDALVDKGLSRSTAGKEIANARQHPYVRGAKEVLVRERKTWASQAS
jgi:hypothetical protein